MTASLPQLRATRPRAFGVFALLYRGRVITDLAEADAAIRSRRPAPTVYGAVQVGPRKRRRKERAA